METEEGRLPLDLQACMNFKCKYKNIDLESIWKMVDFYSASFKRRNNFTFNFFFKGPMS